MDGNKDEALKCIELARKFISDGDCRKAEKFLIKAEKLFPTSMAKDLLESISDGAPPSYTPNSDSARDEYSGNGQGTRRRTTSTHRQPEENIGHSANEYSNEQVAAVNRIKRCKDYYEVLGVSKDATDNDLKKAYRKLALQLHPDKNKVHGASDAFKAVGNAFATLSDPNKRKQYDLYGSEEDLRQSNYSHHYSHDRREYESDVTAEELFNMFFGGGFPSQNVYVRRGGRWTRANATQAEAQQREQANGYTVFLQMLPIFLLIVLSMMSSFFISEPVYSLHQSHKFPVARKTIHLKVPYYVKESFHTDYQGSLKRLEISVEEEYINGLRHACHREKHYRETMLWKARNFGDQQLFQKAQNIRTPSCDTLNQIHVVGG